MKRANHHRSFSLRLKPLAACLATALAFSAGSVVADAKALSAEQLQAQQQASLPARLRAGSVPRPAPWQRMTPMVPASSLHHPVPHQLPALPASTVAVTNCNDSGAGSLRDALENVAVDGDTVDMSGLSCSLISLTTGSILFLQNSITLQGPGTFSLSLSGGVGSARVAPLLHDGTGTLTINDMTIEDGAKYFTDAQIDNARGGCIFSGGFVSLNDSEVKYCTAQNTGSTYGALGGAVYAASGVGLSNTSILDSSVSGTVFGDGGAISTPGTVTIEDSSIEGNTASLVSGGVNALGGAIVKYSNISGNEATYVGGIYVYGNATIENSTIASNTAFGGAGIWFNGHGATTAVTLLSSTVSGNNATGDDNGGIFLYGGHYTAQIANSTIAFNTTHYTADLKYGAGVRSILSTIDLESNIIAGNTNDDGGGPVNDDIDGTTLTLTGGSNLIVSASVTPPADTIAVDPQLMPLADNGGETATHALKVSSPAINAGNNVAMVNYDQRGVGFFRVIGTGPDIGAYEFNLDDVIFRDGFD
jgi:hypothetical protein